MSTQTLRQGEANVSENRLCFRHVTSLLHALLERFDSAPLYLQHILTSQNVRSERTRSDFFSQR